MAALTPLAPSASRLNPRGAHAVAYLAPGDVWSHSDDFTDRLVAEDSGKFSGKVSERLVDIGVADAAGVHPHQYLT
jgi:hypothetical protein